MTAVRRVQLASRTPITLFAVIAIGLAACAPTGADPSSNGPAALPTDVPSAPPVATGSSEAPSLPAVLAGEPWIVFQRWTSTTGARLRLVRPDGTGDHELLPDLGSEQTHPDWSPDGERIAYVVDNDIWVVNADGSASQRLFDCATPCVVGDAPAWSPDGRTIAFVTADAVGEIAPGMKVKAVDVGSGATRTLVETVGPDYAWYVRWSPDGKAVVLGLARYPDTKVTTSTVIGEAVAIVDLTATKPAVRMLTDWAMGASYPDWSWIDDRIVFSTYDLGFRDAGGFEDPSVPSDLYTIDPDGKGLTRLTQNPSGRTLIRNGTASGPLSTQPTWAPDGSSILFVQVDGEGWPGWGMATVNPDGSGLVPAVGSAFVLGTHPRLRPTP